MIGSGDAIDPHGIKVTNDTTIIQPGSPAGDREAGRVYAGKGQVGRPGGAPGAGAERGRTAITDDVVNEVIQKIVDLAVDEVSGVHGLHPGVAAFFGTGTEGSGAERPGVEEPGAEGSGAEGSGRADDDGRAVSVRLDGDQAQIAIAIAVEFGHAVREVADDLRTAVIDSVERLLGLTVTEVNVVVGAVSFAQAGE